MARALSDKRPAFRSLVEMPISLQKVVALETARGLGPVAVGDELVDGGGPPSFFRAHLMQELRKVVGSVSWALRGRLREVLPSMPWYVPALGTAAWAERTSASKVGAEREMGTFSGGAVGAG